MRKAQNIRNKKGCWDAPEGFALVPIPKQGSIHEAAILAIDDFWSVENSIKNKPVIEQGISLAGFGELIRSFVENSQKYVLESRNDKSL